MIKNFLNFKKKLMTRWKIRRRSLMSNWTHAKSKS
jgi:hypothetical protein